MKIDTGAQGNSIQPDKFDAFIGTDIIRLGSRFASVTVAGEVRGDRGRLSSLKVGPFAHEGIRVARVDSSSVGLDYLSRFCVTFDFPENVMYLRKGLQFAKNEPAATSGLMLKWDGDEIRVDSVREDGPADLAGIKSRDILVQINGKPAAEFDPFALRQLLTSAGGTKVRMTILRRTMEFEVELTLNED